VVELSGNTLPPSGLPEPAAANLKLESSSPGAHETEARMLWSRRSPTY
jgi:hypothetical protein